jgi:hypothetical protein
MARETHHVVAGSLLALLVAGCSLIVDVGPLAEDDSGRDDVDGNGDVEADAEVDTDADEGADADEDTDGGADADADADEGGDAYSDVDADADADADEGSDADAFVPVTDCTGYPDFTPCILVTTPTDYSYDICSGGACVSPGSCGDSSCNAPGPDFPLADTGQRVCYNDSSFIPCPGTPGGAACATTPFCGQDAQYGWDVLRTSDERYTVTTPVADEPLVTDNVTHLFWQGCPLGLRGPDCSSTDAPVTDCEALVWAGLDDWRLPSADELQSIVNYASSSPSIDSAVFPGTPSVYFGTFSAQGALVGLRLNIRFDNGQLVGGDAAARRCVRGGSASSVVGSRFTRSEPTSGEPIVEDGLTGLVWQGCVAGLTGTDCVGGTRLTRNWQGALASCEGLTWSGLSDWRLPSIVELRSVIDDRRGGYDLDAFPDMTGGTRDFYCWTSTTFGSFANMAWYVDPNWGVTGVDQKGAAYFPFRCVRGES